MSIQEVVIAVLLPAGILSNDVGESLLRGSEMTGEFDEHVRWVRFDSGVRVLMDAPKTMRPCRRLLVVYATPNGSTLEQTLGCASAQGGDKRFDLQHVAAQIRRLREIDAAQNIVLAVVQAPQQSWPTFRRDQPRAGRIITELVESLAKESAANRVVLAGHSGGGSLIFGYLNAVDSIPSTIERIVLLDANYAYSDDEHHGTKLLVWLRGDVARRLVVVAYDDREILLSGRRVVGPDGGTFRASQRMLARLRCEVELTEQAAGPFRQTSDKNGQIQFFLHPNPDNRILHTALVGEMNGLLHGLTLGTDLEGAWGRFGGPRAYTRWIQSQPFVEPAATPPAQDESRLPLPERPRDAPTGSKFQEQIAALPLAQREAAVVREITRGNLPNFLRRLKPIHVQATDRTGARRVATCFVSCDYLAVGSDDDFFRVPLTPQTGVTIADALGCMLLTAKLSDDVFSGAEVRLEPQPLTKEREAVATFYQHHRLIEDQRRGQQAGLLVAGIKKDLVLTRRLKERPHRVAIYGWHRPDGQPIQPLYVGHQDTYVDYSHGIRLLAGRMIVDGRTLHVSDVLKDPRLCTLVSNEGPIDVAELRQAAGWRR